MNKYEVAANLEKPHYKVMNVLGHWGFDSTSITMEAFCDKAMPSAIKAGSKAACNMVDVTNDMKEEPIMQWVFPKPFVFEVKGIGFTKKWGSDDWALRHPTVVKFREEVSCKETISWEELQRMGNIATTRPEKDELTKQIHEWLMQLQTSPGRGPSRRYRRRDNEAIGFDDSDYESNWSSDNDCEPEDENEKEATQNKAANLNRRYTTVSGLKHPIEVSNDSDRERAAKAPRLDQGRTSQEVLLSSAIYKQKPEENPYLRKNSGFRLNTNRQNQTHTQKRPIEVSRLPSPPPQLTKKGIPEKIQKVRRSGTGVAGATKHFKPPSGPRKPFPLPFTEEESSEEAVTTERFLTTAFPGQEMTSQNGVPTTQYLPTPPTSSQSPSTAFMSSLVSSSTPPLTPTTPSSIPPLFSSSDNIILIRTNPLDMNAAFVETLNNICTKTDFKGSTATNSNTTGDISSVSLLGRQNLLKKLSGLVSPHRVVLLVDHITSAESEDEASRKVEGLRRVIERAKNRLPSALNEKVEVWDWRILEDLFGGKAKGIGGDCVMRNEGRFVG